MTAQHHRYGGVILFLTQTARNLSPGHHLRVYNLTKTHVWSSLSAVTLPTHLVHTHHPHNSLRIAYRSSVPFSMQTVGVNPDDAIS